MILQEILQKYQSEILYHTQVLCRINSVKDIPMPQKPFGEGVADALSYMENLCLSLGFDVQVFDGYALHAEMGQGKYTLGILAHLDVVPEGDGWTYPPFGAEIHNGKIYARGAQDDKGPAIAALFAVKAVFESGHVPNNCRVRLIFGCDEESGGNVDIQYYKKQVKKLPDFGFSPDADFPLIYIEKGITRLMLTGQNDGEANLLSLFGGLRPNVVPDYAEAKIALPVDFSLPEKAVSNFNKEYNAKISVDISLHMHVASRGKTAHAMAPKNGKNAVSLLLLFLNRYVPCGSFVKGLAEMIGLQTDGGRAGLAGVDEAGPLTLNIGIISLEKNNPSAILDIRYPLCMDKDTIENQLQAVLSPYHVEVKTIFDEPPHHVPKDHPLVKTLLKVYADITGLPASPIAIGGGTYARCMQNTVAFGALFPGSPDVMHQKDEFIDIEDLMLATRIYAEAVRALTQTDPKAWLG